MFEEKFVELDSGKKLFVRIGGNGNPAVVIETGWMSFSPEWINVQTELQKYATVITYDRAGYGESPAGEKPRSSLSIAKELKELLDKLCFKSPYILVGHSGGGLYMRHFSLIHPNLVGGLVYVDAITDRYREIHEVDAPAYHSQYSLNARTNAYKEFLSMEKDTHVNILKPAAEILFANFDEKIKQQLINYNSDKKCIQAVLDEHDALQDNFSLISETRKNPNIPVKVIKRDPALAIQNAIASGVPEKEALAIEALWSEHQDYLTATNGKSELIEAAGADHNVHLSAPDIIVETVRSLL